ncbi:MAG TPA: EcsC family protein [Myxococcaceae bacterium]|nr:EcsC family protein [Myxococcaceae bacterium]
MDDTTREKQARTLLTAVERLVMSNDHLRELVGACVKRARDRGPEDLRKAAGDEIVRHFSNRAALVGGATALPGLIPGAGTAVAIGGVLADMTMLLKLEVEMALALTHHYGFDVEEEEERQLAFLLASVATHDTHTGKSFFKDVVKVEGTAIWNYAPRQVGQFILNSLVILLAFTFGWRSVLRAIPVIGIGIGVGANKLLTRKVGKRCMSDLETRVSMLRRKQQRKAAAPASRPARTPARTAARTRKPASRSRG